jgi:hypothetical protein
LGIYTSEGLAQKKSGPNLYRYKYPSSLVPVILLVHTTYEDGTECSKTSAHNFQMPGNHPKERIQHSKRGKSLKLRIKKYVLFFQRLILVLTSGQ